MSGLLFGLVLVHGLMCNVLVRFFFSGSGGYGMRHRLWWVCIHGIFNSYVICGDIRKVTLVDKI